MLDYEPTVLYSALMPRRNRLSQERIEQIRDAYNEWAKTIYNPDSLTVDEFAETQGLSKAWLYQLRRMGWDRSNAARPGGQAAQLRSLEEQVNEMRLKHAEAVVRMAELSRKVEELEARLR